MQMIYHTCKSEDAARAILTYSKEKLSVLGLSINIEKTSIKHTSQGFTFLGYNFTGDGSISETTTTPNPYRKPLFVTEPFTFDGNLRGFVLNITRIKGIFKRTYK